MLNLTSIEGHFKETWTAGGNLWLRDFLSGHSARGEDLCFDIMQGPGKSEAAVGIAEYSENLVNQI